MMVSLRDQTIKQLRDEFAALKLERDTAQQRAKELDEIYLRVCGERDFWKGAASGCLVERDRLRRELKKALEGRDE